MKQTMKTSMSVHLMRFFSSVSMKATCLELEQLLKRKKLGAKKIISTIEQFNFSPPLNLEESRYQDVIFQ